VWARRRRRIEQKVFWTAEQRAQQKREVNRIHSLQKRRRRHDEHEYLKEQVSSLESMNLQAKITRDYLEQLLREANDAVERFKSGIVDGYGTAREPPQPPTRADSVFEPLPEPDEGPEEPLPFGILASLEPDPIAPTPCNPFATELEPSGSIRPFASWADAVRNTLEESPARAACMPYASYAFQRRVAEADEPHSHYGRYAVTGDPLGDLLRSSATTREFASLHPSTLTGPGSAAEPAGPSSGSPWVATRFVDPPGYPQGGIPQPPLLRDVSSKVFPVRMSDDTWTPSSATHATSPSFLWAPDVGLCRSVSLVSPGDPTSNARMQVHNDSKALQPPRAYDQQQSRF
jgi:hypothetical protein